MDSFERCDSCDLSYIEHCRTGQRHAFQGYVSAAHIERAQNILRGERHAREAAERPAATTTADPWAPEGGYPAVDLF